MLRTDLAICIRTVDYSETSQVVTFFARSTGKVGAIAKGSKRPKSPFAGPIEMLAAGHISFTDTDREKLATLTEFEQTSAHPNIISDLYRYNCCLFAAELTNLLTDDYDPHPGLYDSLLTMLVSANNAPADSPQNTILAPLITFQLNLLHEIGLAPVMTTCINCKQKFNSDWSAAWFSHANNGLICKDCEMSFPDKTPITKKTVLSLANSDTLESMSPQALNEIERLLVDYLTYHLCKIPKMAKHILKK